MADIILRKEKIELDNNKEIIIKNNRTIINKYNLEKSNPNEISQGKLCLCKYIL